MNPLPRLHRRRFIGATLACVVGGASRAATAAATAAATPAATPAPQLAPQAWPAAIAALRYRDPARQPMLAAALAGTRVVAAGLRGVIVCSDDGKTFVQAQVPVSADLTALSFVDEKHGWAVGNDGVVLSTRDGGTTWALQRQAFGSDERLFSVMFTSRTAGLAVGGFGLCLATSDGGTRWSAVDVAREGQSAPHLYQLLPGRSGASVIVGEFGSIFLSRAARHWSRVQSPVANSLFGGAVCGDQLIAVGLQGAVAISQDGGAVWRRATVAGAPNLLAALCGPAQQLVLVDTRGGLLRSCDAGHTFTRREESGLSSPTCGVWHPARAGPQLFSLDGVAPAADRAERPSPHPCAS